MPAFFSSIMNGIDGDKVSKGPYTKTIKEKTHTGVPIKLTIIYHDDEVGKEFIVSSPDFSFTKWILWTSFFYIMGCTLKSQMEDERVLVVTILLLLLALGYKLHNKVKTESLLVVKSVGIQLTTTFATGRKVVKFYDSGQVKDVIINEGVTMFKVIFYLSLLLRNHPSSEEDHLLPIYSHSWPRLSCIQQVYQETFSILFGYSKNTASTIASNSQ